MTGDNYSFSLAAGACAKLMTAHARGSITNGELKAIVDATEIFLNSEVPVLLGKIDLMRMIGEADELGWEDEARMLSQRAWQMLKAASSTAPEERTSAEAELQEDRDNWIRAFAMFDEGLREWLSENPNRRNQFPLHPFEHPLLEQQFRSLAACSVNRHPDMAERVDLRMRYTWRQWVRSRQKKDGYNPASKKSRNDGVDLDMYSYLMLPALVVAGDKNFHSRIAYIKSPQLNWFFQPQDLANAWKRGERRRPAWASSALDRSCPTLDVGRNFA